MNTEEALAFLACHQPMPSDADISEDEGDTFCSILKHFEQDPDPRCLPLLIHSVSPSTGLGMYEDITSVLLAHQKSDVVPHLQHGLTTGNDGVKYRCCWWAADIDAWNLAEQIRPLATYGDEDIRDAAKAFLKLSSEIA